ncbi:Protein MAIN-LIKE 1, partial [Bienertia sinuspersici]
MDKLKEATKLQMCRAEKHLCLVEKRLKSSDEPLKLLNKFKELILDRSQQEVERLQSQLDFLQLVNEVLFEEVTNMMESLVCASKEETENMRSFNGFLCLGQQLISDEMLAQTELESKRSLHMEIAALNSNICEIQKKLDALVAKKEKLEEKVGPSVSGFDISVHDEVKDTLDPVEKFEDESDLVDDQGLVDITKTKKSIDDIRPGSLPQVIHVRTSCQHSPAIDDDSTEVSCYSPQSEEVTSGVSTTQSNIMAKGIRKWPQHLRTRCNQSKLCNFLSNLRGEKRRIIEKSIFKPFLYIPPRSICLSFLHAFIERYHVRTDSFTIDKTTMRFCGKEVENVLGINYDGRLVDFTTKVKKTPQVILHYFGVDGRITKDSLMEKLKQMHVSKENADDFFRLS